MQNIKETLLCFLPLAVLTFVTWFYKVVSPKVEFQNLEGLVWTKCTHSKERARLEWKKIRLVIRLHITL